MGRSSTRWPFARSGGEIAARPRTATVVAVGVSIFSLALLYSTLSSLASSARARRARLGTLKCRPCQPPPTEPVLVVGNGALKGFPLYAFSGDQGGKNRCGTSLATGYDLGPITSMPLTCTGPESDLLKGVKSDDWPAFTSVGPPRPGLESTLDCSQQSVAPASATKSPTTVTLSTSLIPSHDRSCPRARGTWKRETVGPLARVLVSPLCTSGEFAPSKATLVRGVLPNGSKSSVCRHGRKCQPSTGDALRLQRQAGRSRDLRQRVRPYLDALVDPRHPGDRPQRQPSTRRDSSTGQRRPNRLRTAGSPCFSTPKKRSSSHRVSI
jgi:hypothetical protein